MKSASEAVQSSLNLFFEASAADLEMTVENLSVNLACLSQSRNQHTRGVARVLSYTSSVLLPTLTSLFQHLGLQNSGGDLLGKGFLDEHLEIPTLTRWNMIFHRLANLCPRYVVEMDEQLDSTPVSSHRSFSCPHYPFRSLKLALIKHLCHGHRATWAYCLAH